MQSPRKPLILIALALLVGPSTAAAQRLQPGTWTGTVTPPNGETVNVTFDVRETGDTVSITLKSEFGDFPFSSIKVAPDRLTFTFTPGTPVDCTLMLRENGNYSGDCIDSDGEAGIIVMIPPAETASSTRKPRHGRL